MAEEGKQPPTRVGASPVEDEDAEFGGHEARKVLERKLLRKIDLRMSILVVIYILNYVRTTPKIFTPPRSRCFHRLTATTRGTSTTFCR